MSNRIATLALAAALIASGLAACADGAAGGGADAPRGIGAVSLENATGFAPPAAPEPLRRRAGAGAGAPDISPDRAGGLCGDPRIYGARIAPVGGPGACGIPEAVSVSAIAGVRLSRAARMDCATARALADWTEQSARPVFADALGAALTNMRVAAGYACRTRNSQRGARLSEHAKGKAIDISAFTLADGRVVTVLDGWSNGGSGAAALRRAWRGACGPFGTVLGPESDVHHRDHFHFDTASHRGGPYCR